MTGRWWGGRDQNETQTGTQRMRQREGKRKKRGSEKVRWRESVLGRGSQEGLLALNGALLALQLVLCWGNQLEKTVFSKSSRIGGFSLWDG